MSDHCATAICGSQFPETVKLISNDVPLPISGRIRIGSIPLKILKYIL